MRGWERLARREVLTLHRRLECVVVAVGALPFLERHPPQDRAVGYRVVHASRPGARQRLGQRELERLVLPLSVARADALDETSGVAFLAAVDRDRDALPQ